MKKNRQNDTLEPLELENRKSRSQVKREFSALQKTGERLVTLSVQQLDAINMPVELREALLAAKKIRARGARKRQLQYIGALMRKIDTDPISRALHEIDRGRGVRAADFHRIEKWRDDVVRGLDTPIGEIMNRFPGTDKEKLLLLVGNARKEMSGGRALKSARALFRYIKKMVEEG